MHITVLIAGLSLITLLLIALLRTLFIRSHVDRRMPQSQLSQFSLEKVELMGQHLSTAVSFSTVAHHESKLTDDEPFMQLHRFFEEAYPLIHANLTRVDVGDPLNIVFKWQGSDVTRTPALLMAHQDVVPAHDEDGWTYPPFGKTVTEGYVWGRGSFDAKGQMIAILEAVETLVENHVQPVRTWYIAFGCDEEIRGSRGAQSIVAFFKENGIRFAFVLDEGGVVAKGFVGGISDPVAVIGIAEKSNVTLQLSCTKQGGHSSSPDNPTALAVLGRAVWRIEKWRSPVHIGVPVQVLLRTLGEHAPFYLSFVLLNLWLFSPLIKGIFSKSPTMNALIRTTVATTMAQGSDAENVLPKTASCIVNIRTLPEETTEQLHSRLRKIIKDPSIEIEIIEDSKRSRPSSIEKEGFTLISNIIRQTFSAVPTPYLMTGGTDALHYEAVSKCVYRFTPAVMDTSELNRMHNVDERFSLENLERAVQFYTALITQDTKEIATAL